ncbi:Riboflavin biosynthesis protein RibD [compost metagenome]
MDLKLAFGLLGREGISSILVEGGGRINGSLIQEKLVDEVALFFAPKLIGGLGSTGSFVFEGFDEMKDAVSLENMSVEVIEDNVLIKGTPVWKE